MEDRNLESLGQIGRVVRRPGIGRIGGESHLIVHDDVDRAAGAVGIQARNVERLRHDAFAGKRGITVNRDRHHRQLVPLARTPGNALQRAHHTFHHRIDNFQMRGIGHQAQPNVASINHARTDIPHVVLHIARGLVVVIMPTLKLGEQRFERFAHDICEHIQPTTMRHADNNLARARTPRFVNDGIEHRNERVGSFDRKTLVTHVRPSEKALQPIHLIEPSQHRALLVNREVAREHTIAKGQSKPFAFVIRFEMPYFVADML